MDKYTIGNNAGILWNLMNRAGSPQNFEDLRQKTHLSDAELYAAIGWLARENKIEVEVEEDNHMFVFYLNMGCYYY
ncbi:MAG: winged helix-turn-helix domain-containing protein [Mediterranea massiliensis]|nr:winged helix-turn-helix domain-containing protein [Mediterranea massiliensis]